MGEVILLQNPSPRLNLRRKLAEWLEDPEFAAFVQMAAREEDQDAGEPGPG